jgi:hypothetical protein
MVATGSGERLAVPEYSPIVLRGAYDRIMIEDIAPDGAVLMAEFPGLTAFKPGMGSQGKVIRLVDNAAVYTAKFSPDGRWVVYWLRNEGPGIYVQPLGAPGARRQIAGSGRWPVWRKDGKEILYANEGTLMSIPVEGTDIALRFGSPHPLFSGLRQAVGTVPRSMPLAVSHDGSRIFWVQGAAETESNVIQVRTNVIR